MICTNCYESEMAITTTSIVDCGETIEAECEKCPKCGHIVFTHEQSLAVDEKRQEALRRYAGSSHAAA